MSKSAQLQKSFFNQQVSGHSIFIKLNNGERIAKSCSLENDNEQIFYEWIQHVEGYQEFFSEYGGIIDIQTDEINQCQDENTQIEWLNSLIKKRFKPNNRKFLLLENITYNCHNPRILDLKLGFDVEKPTHIKRYQESTSSKIGFRVCGMKIEEEGKLILFKDKQWGRRVSVQEVLENLKLFFLVEKKNGTFIRQLDILKKITDKIEELKNFIISSCKEVVSWQGASLLLVIGQQVIVKIIDFSKAKILLNSEKANDDIIKALESLQSILLSL